MGIILQANSSYIQKNRQKRKCEAKKKRCASKGGKRHCIPIFPYPQTYKSRRCKPIPYPIPCCEVPNYPPKPHSNLIVEKECCGNILIQGKQAGFQIWESDVEANITLAQISIYSNHTSTDTLEVEINGLDSKKLFVPPGNTINCIAQDIKSITIPSQGIESGYIEGKYNISITLRLDGISTLSNQI